jgi:hypothetical protein
MMFAVTSHRAMRIWVATLYGLKEPLDVSPSMRIEAVRRRIGQLPAIMEESGAWTINGWQAHILKSALYIVHVLGTDF